MPSALRRQDAQLVFLKGLPVLSHVVIVSCMLLGRTGLRALVAGFLAAALAGPIWASSPARTPTKLAVDVNAVSAAELEQVRGIGPALAERIIAARNSGGKFRDTDDLRRRVRGLGDTNLRRMMAAGLVLSPSVRIAPVADPERPRVELVMGNIPAKSEARSVGRIEEIACCGRATAASQVPGPHDPPESDRAVDPAPKGRAKR